MTFVINGATKETARLYSDKILATGLEDRRSYSGLEEEDRYYNGYIGELTFRNALWYYGKAHIYSPRVDGHSDLTDFRVHTKTAERTINVKTATKDHHRFLMLPDKQYRKYRNDCYVGAHILGGEFVKFEGWITHQELDKYKPVMVKVKTRKCPFTELRSIESLFDSLL